MKVSRQPNVSKTKTNKSTRTHDSDGPQDAILKVDLFVNLGYLQTRILVKPF